MYYYGARYYDPRISIFVSVDPLAEKTMEPYLYTGNNPIMFTDPTGMSKVWQGGDPPKKSNWSFAKIKSDLNKAYVSTRIRDGVEWFKNNDFAGGVGGYIFSGIGSFNFGGRPYLVCNSELTGIPLVSVTDGKQASFQTDCFEDFWQGFVNSACCNLHLDILRGRSDHHKMEGLFKAAARALRDAITVDPRRQGAVPYTKGVIV